MPVEGRLTSAPLKYPIFESLVIHAAHFDWLKPSPSCLAPFLKISTSLVGSSSKNSHRDSVNCFVRGGGLDTTYPEKACLSEQNTWVGFSKISVYKWTKRDTKDSFIYSAFVLKHLQNIKDTTSKSRKSPYANMECHLARTYNPSNRTGLPSF